MKIITAYPGAYIKAAGLDSLNDSDKYEYLNGELDIPSIKDVPIVDEVAVAEKERLAKVHTARVKEYPPIGDQLDAIWMQLNSMRLGGTDLVSDADHILGKILAVKKKHPKGE